MSKKRAFLTNLGISLSASFLATLTAIFLFVAGSMLLLQFTEADPSDGKGIVHTERGIFLCPEFRRWLSYQGSDHCSFVDAVTEVVQHTVIGFIIFLGFIILPLAAPWLSLIFYGYAVLIAWLLSKNERQHWIKVGSPALKFVAVFVITTLGVLLVSTGSSLVMIAF